MYGYKLEFVHSSRCNNEDKRIVVTKIVGLRPLIFVLFTRFKAFIYLLYYNIIQSSTFITSESEAAQRIVKKNKCAHICDK